jgi:hypothetical protein
VDFTAAAEENSFLLSVDATACRKESLFVLAVYVTSASCAYSRSQVRAWIGELNGSETSVTHHRAGGDGCRLETSPTAGFG